MNANENTTAQNSSEDSPKVTHLEAGDRVEIRLRSYLGGMDQHPSPFTTGSVAEYATRYNEDAEAAVERAKRLGHELYYMVNEGIAVTAHRQAHVERISLSLGDLVEMDGQTFTVTQAPNYNVKLVPVTEA